MTQKAVSMKVTGIVQGVGFRWVAQRIANQLHLNGFVRNNPDGTVYTEVVGAEADVNKYIEMISGGPSPSSRVDHVEIHTLNPLPDYKEFKVTF
ncbi:acylphosphatase [Lactobacillus selangorensis]|nr:acylphosphatase [Lactobacillus selangorensis]